MSQPASLSLADDPKNVVMRFAPNPNGPPTIGHARGIVVNNYFVRKYGGEFILRFDDTDPKNKKPLLKAYDWYLADLNWLDAKPDKTVIASERLRKYYKVAETLIEKENAYVCQCSRDDFKRFKDAQKECPCRTNEPAENLKLWNKMLEGSFDEGDAVLRIKTDIRSADPALRDWVAARIIKAEHPKVGSEYFVWPMLDFESAVEDHLQGITHIIRGKDLIDSEKRQKFIYDYLGWDYPITLHWGRIRLADFGKFSTSQMASDIEAGNYSGWDDVRLPTLRALKRRGITADAIKNTMLSLGLSESDITLSMENLYAENRKVLDPVAGRYFFVEENGYDLKTENPQKKTIRLPINPNKKHEGKRETSISIKDSSTLCCVPADDAQNLEVGDVVKLIGQSFVKVTSVDSKNRVIHSKIAEKTKDAKKIHWTIPAEYVEGNAGHVKVRILMPDGSDLTGYAEHSVSRLEVGDIVQFERLGFARLDSSEPELIFCYGHN